LHIRLFEIRNLTAFYENYKNAGHLHDRRFCLIRVKEVLQKKERRFVFYLNAVKAAVVGCLLGYLRRAAAGMSSACYGIALRCQRYL